MAYDAEGQVLTVTDPLNRVTTYSYSVRGWVATVTDPMGFSATYVYSPTGKLTGDYGYLDGQWVDTAGYSYDSDDRAVSYTDGLGHWTTYSYDGVGNRKSVTDANNNATTYSYDSRNRLTTVTDALSHTTGYGYDSAGNRQTVTDALGHTTTTLYDALNRAATITSAINETTTIAYDAAGRETSLTDPVANKTQWAYDADDRLTTMTDPLNHSATYVYDGDGELTDTTDRDGRRTTYSYDADGNRTGETWVGASPSQRVTYTFDADREMTGVTDSFATLTVVYDKDSRVGTLVTSGPGSGQPTVTLTYSHDQLGDETSVTDSLSSQGLTTYSYDLAQRMTTITTSYGGTAGPQVVNTYDAGNRLTTIVRTVGPNFPGVNANIWYDNANRVVTIVDFSHVASTQHSGYVDTSLATYVYGYDNANRVTSEMDAEGTATFTYDNANELTAVGGSRSESYSYDLNGNRNSSGYTTGTANELTASPGVTYTYDAEGNLTSQTNTSTHVTTSYTYDYRNRLTVVTVGGTATATYTYDALDRRIGIKDSGTQTWTVYDGTSPDALPYADFNGSGSLTQRYLSGAGVINGALVDDLLARTSSGGTTAWYLPDKLGTVRDIADGSGNELDHIVYDSFGNITTETNATNGDRFKFAGMEYDSTTGQYYDRARDYNSAAGRFTSQDPTWFAAGDTDLYRYVFSDPVDAVDPSGLMPPPSGGLFPIPPGGDVLDPGFWARLARQQQEQFTHYNNLYIKELRDFERLMIEIKARGETEQRLIEKIMEHFKIEASKTLKDSRGFDVQLKFEATFNDAWKRVSAMFRREEAATRAQELARQRAEAQFRMQLYSQKLDEAEKYRHAYQSMSDALR
jgi:RHS repeat-associated protein